LHRLALRANLLTMKRDAQITFRIPHPLRVALEEIAAADGERSLAGVVRKAAVEFVDRHITSRSGGDTGVAA
jgi:hypothetical protein